MRKTSKILALFLAFIFLISNVSIHSKAASYPLMFFVAEDFKTSIYSAEVNAGEYYQIRILWYAAYNNEGYDLKIYDSKGSVVSTASNTWVNSTKERHLTIPWNTNGIDPGDYKIVVTKRFYSLFRWNDAPTQSTLNIKVKPNYKIDGTEKKLATLWIPRKYKKSFDKKVTKLNANTKYALKLVNEEGIAKFKATKTKKYKFIYSNIGTLSGAKVTGDTTILKVKK